MTIRDIAARAGVSAATVSRVLNNPAYRCSSEEVRKRIWQVARETGYLPNQAARMLKMGSRPEAERVRTVDVLVTRSGRQASNPFFNEMLRCIQGEVHQQRGMLGSVWYESGFADDRVCRRSTAVRMVESLLADSAGARGPSASAGMPVRAGETATAAPRRDGIVIIGKCRLEAVRVLAARYEAVVSISRNPGTFVADEVVCDGARIARLAVDYLVGLGHRYIGYAGECRDDARFRGFQEALVYHGLSIEIGNVAECELSERAGFTAMAAMLKREDRPTAIFCENDMIALGMIRCLARFGSSYDRPSIIGCDDIEEGQFCRPMLTTIGMPKAEMARHAVNLLFDRMAGGHAAPVRLELDPKLMVRESCFRFSGDERPEYVI